MFDKNSGLVQVWVRLIQNGTYSLNDVPNLSNLKDVVTSIITGQEEETEQGKKARAFDFIVEGGVTSE